MSSYTTRACLAAAATVALSAAGLTASAAGMPAPVPRPARTASGRAPGGPGAQLWVKRYNGPGNGPDVATSEAVSPDGKTVYVTGYSASAGTMLLYDYATIAYDAATGHQVWLKRYNGPGNGDDKACSVAVSPDGKTVFVTGYSYGGSARGDAYATVAYNAATGQQRWVRRYNGPAPGNSEDVATSAAVSRDGSTVYVTGYSYAKATSGLDYATVAYNAATGQQRWVKRYDGPVSGDDHAHSVAVSGSTVYVTGVSSGAHDAFDYATVAYSATGRQLWVRRYDGATSGSLGANSIAVSPGGKTVFVTGASLAANHVYDYATVAYRAATGHQLWAKRYRAPGSIDNQADSVAVSPGGKAVFVTGTAGYDYATVAYNAASGTQLWVKRYTTVGGANDAYSVAVSPAGGTVYVTGAGDGGIAYTTVAYSAITGTQQWVRSYAGPAGGGATWVAVSPATGTVYVTGHSIGKGYDYATVAYQG
jgi:outer membrane protein assembly factor BamB